MKVRVKNETNRPEFSRPKRYHQRRRFNLFKFLKNFGIMVVIFLLLEVGWILLTNFYLKPVVAGWDTIEKGTWIEALFLRYETLVFAPVAGKVEFKIADGTRVPAGEVVAEIKYDSKDVEDNHKELQLNQELVEEQKLLQADLDRVEAEIAQKRYLTKSSSTGKINAELKKLLTEQAQITKLLSESQKRIAQNKLAAEDIYNNPALIPAPTAGIWYAGVDGLEKRLSPDALTRLSLEDFKHKEHLHRPREQMMPREVMGKIISPFDQVIVVVAANKEMKQAKQNDKWLIRTGNDVYKVTIADRLVTSDGRVMLALSDFVLPNNWLPQRQAKIYLVYQCFSGVTIPLPALYREKGVTTVRIRDKNGIRTQAVKLIATDDGKAIVEGIQFGTTVLSKLF